MIGFKIRKDSISGGSILVFPTLKEAESDGITLWGMSRDGKVFDSLTHYRPAMPFGNRNFFLRTFSAQYCHNLKNITPLEI